VGTRCAGAGAGAEETEVELEAEDAGETGVVVSRAEWARAPSVWGSLGVDDDDDMIFVGSVTGLCCDDHGI